MGVRHYVDEAKILRAAVENRSVVIRGVTYDYRPYRKIEGSADTLYDLPRSLSHLIQKPFVAPGSMEPACAFMVLLNFKIPEKLPLAKFLADRKIHDEGTPEFSRPDKASMLLCRHTKSVLNAHYNENGDDMSFDDWLDEAFHCKTLCHPDIVIHGVDRFGLHLPSLAKRCGRIKKRSPAFAGLQNPTWILSEPEWRYPSATGDYSVASIRAATQCKLQREQIRAIYNGRVP